MPTSYSYLLNEVLLPTTTIFFFVSSLIATAVGVGLIFCDTAMFRLFNVMNRWVSMRRLLKFAETSRDIEKPLHQRLRLLGVVVVLGAGITVYNLLSMKEVSIIRTVLEDYLPPVTVRVVAESAKWFFFFGNAFAVLIGIGMLFFPAILAGIEERANKWYSVRQNMRGMDTMHMPIDNWVSAYPRAAGGIIVFLGLFLALNLAVVFFVRH